MFGAFIASKYRHLTTITPIKGKQICSEISLTTVLFENATLLDGIKCLHSYFEPGHSGSECKLTIGKNDRIKADLHRNALSTCRPNTPSLQLTLGWYVRCLLCKKHRYSIASDSKSLWAQKINHWTDVIKKTYTEDVRTFFMAQEASGDERTLKKIESEVYKKLDIEEPKVIQKSPMPGYYPLSQSSQATERPDECEIVDTVLESIHGQYIHRFRNSTTGTKDDTSGIVADFTPYRPNADLLSDLSDLSDIFAKTLTFEDSQSGYIYIYRSKSADDMTWSSYVKIGYTTGNVKKRLDAWSQCGSELEEVKAMYTCNAKRVESFIHKELELAGKRRYDHRCRKSQRSCRKRHNEWHEISAEEAIEVVSYWIDWMRTYAPYSSPCGSPKTALLKMYDALQIIADSNGLEPENTDTKMVRDSTGRVWFPSYTPQEGQRDPQKIRERHASMPQTTETSTWSPSHTRAGHKAKVPPDTSDNRMGDDGMTYPDLEERGTDSDSANDIQLTTPWPSAQFRRGRKPSIATPDDVVSNIEDTNGSPDRPRSILDTTMQPETPTPATRPSDLFSSSGGKKKQRPASDLKVSQLKTRTSRRQPAAAAAAALGRRAVTDSAAVLAATRRRTMGTEDDPIYIDSW